MCLFGVVVWVLVEDDYFDLFEWCGVKCGEDLWVGWEYLCFGGFVLV